MAANGWIQIALFSVIVIAVTRPLGGYMSRVFAGERTLLWPVLRPVERAVYWCGGVDENEQQHWLTYAIAIRCSVSPFCDALRIAAAAVVSAVQSAGSDRGGAGSCDEHLGQLYHQHQLAGL